MKVTIEMNRRNQYEIESFMNKINKDNEEIERKSKEAMISQGDVMIFMKVMGNDMSDESIDRAQKIMEEQREKRKARKVADQKIVDMKKKFKKEAQNSWWDCFGKAIDIDNNWIKEEINRKMKEATK